MIPPKVTPKQVEDFIAEWHALFPDRTLVKTKGYLKAQPKDCVNKMKKFVKDCPTVTKELIFAATKLYLAEQQANDWDYTSRPYYFIQKQERGSLLFEYVERVIANQLEVAPRRSAVYNPVDEFL